MNKKEIKLADTIETLKTFIVDACADTKKEINNARKSGDKYAQDFVKPFKTNTGFDTLVEKSASLMGQMTAGGVTLLMCPMKVASKELTLNK